MSSTTTGGSTASNGASASTKTPRGNRFWLILAGILVLGTLAAIAALALLTNIFEKRQESLHPNFQIVQLNEKSFDPAEWGKNFPLQFEGWKNTANNVSENVPRDPVPTDPAQPKDVPVSKLKADPRLVTIWQGYAFSTEYNEPRGHAFMLDDQRLVKRVTNFKQPGACLNCHSSLPEVLDAINPNDHADAWAQMNKMPYADATKFAKHPVGCIDCHDPQTNALRVTRPAFIEGIKEYKASQGVANFDPNKDATHNEMRAYVCAQCHVEYYFKGDAKTLTFPWEKGLTATDALNYYDEVGFSDFTNTVTGAKVVKAQHPDFETWSQGIHAKNGVTCADCHMPYGREGAGKITDHQVRSPLEDTQQINRTCLTCHKATEEEMKGRVENIQSIWRKEQNVSFDALDQLIRDIDQARKSGVAADRIAAAQQWQRKAQFFQDYTVSENSKGFHAPQYSLSLINEITDAARRGQLALQGKSEPMTTDPRTITPVLGTPLPAPATPAPASTPTPIVNPVYNPAPAATPSK